MSRAARELIEFLDEGPPEDDRLVEGETDEIAARPSTPKKTSAFSRLPQRIRKISRRQKSMGENGLKENAPALPQAESPSKPLVSPDVRELIDFLDEGPPEDVEPSPSSSKMSSPTKVLRDKLDPLVRSSRRQKPKNLSVDVPDLSTPREPRVSPHSADSRSSGSQPYISQSARDLVDFLNEGPPREVRKRRRQRDGSVASEESTRSMPSMQKLRSMLSRGPGPAMQGAGSESTELLVPSYTRPPSVVSSLDMYMLPLPGVFDDSPVYDGQAASPAGAHDLVQPSAEGEKMGAVASDGDADNSLDPSSRRARALAVAQPTPAANIAASALVVFSSVMLYMLLSTPFS